MPNRGKKLSRNQKRRLQKKLKKQEEDVARQLEAQRQLAALQESMDSLESDHRKSGEGHATELGAKPQGVQVEYVTSEVEVPKELADAFASVVKSFGVEDEGETESTEAGRGKREEEEEDDGNASDMSNSDGEEEDGASKKLSNRQKKKLSRASVGELKKKVSKPELVESWDVAASDPLLLVELKAHENAVPVPRHWNNKSKYLSRKRGFEKAPFQLPDYIVATGITKMRDALNEARDEQTSKQRQRDRARPKMGRMEIDYQVLHDAFFRYQTKPKLTHHGDLYYEGKELEAKEHKSKPGVLSEALREALGMVDGAPPPWLTNQQRYGPPPSYPNLKIPGVNAPLPPGAQWGFHAGGWGKAPVDHMGNPLYGNVFASADDDLYDEHVDKSHWGELEEEEWESSEDEDSASEDEDEDGDQDQEEAQHGDDDEGDEDVSGMTSTGAAMETEAGSFDLRKASVAQPGAEDGPKSLYTVLDQQSTRVGGGLMGSQFQYVMPSGETGSSRGSRSGGGRSDGVVLNLDEEDLANLDEATIKKRYEEQMAANRVGSQREDLSDMVAEHMRSTNAKRRGDGGERGAGERGGDKRRRVE